MSRWRVSGLSTSSLLGLSLVVAAIFLPGNAAAQGNFCNGELATIEGAGTIQGTEDDDVIYDIGLDSVINGAGGDDLICANDGVDQVFAGDGQDTVFMGPGGTLDGGSYNRACGPAVTDGFAERVIGGSGADFATGSDGADCVRGLFDNDAVLGGPGPDDVRGEDGADFVQGGDGDDFLRDGFGPDDLTGGEGGDDRWQRCADLGTPDTFDSTIETITDPNPDFC